MKKLRSAFTLIELLVVIAIIAILASILFPVFAQAKAAAKTAVSISNMKQLELACLIYSNDYDDMRVPQVNQDIAYNSDGTFNHVINEWNWKQLLLPYTKSRDLFKDSVDPASKYVDLHSDPAARAAENWTPVNLDPSLITYRGYAWANSWNGQFDHGLNMTGWRDPAMTLSICESKEYFETMGPYLTWNQDVDQDTGFPAGVNPVTGLQWNWSGEKYGEKANAVAFQDGHAKRLAFSAMCSPSLNPAPAGSVNYWGLSAGDADWATAYCTTDGNPGIPAQFR